MKQVQIDVVNMELFKTGAECSLYIFSVFLPELRGNEYLLAFYARSPYLLESLSDCALVLINRGCVDCAVAMLDDGCADNWSEVALACEEGAEANLGELVSV